MSYFSSPIRLSVVGQAAGLSAPYRMSALVGKTVYNVSAVATVLPTTLALSTFNGKRFGSPENQGIVTTFVGSGSPTFADGTGTGASFYAPFGMAFDASGNLIVADSGNNRIRKVTPEGVVTTIAGSGAYAFADGTGTGASFKGPADIVIDANGNIIVADHGNNRIRKVTNPGGVVTTLAGSGSGAFADGTGTGASFYGPTGVAVDASDNVIVVDTYNSRIRLVTSGGVVTTLAGSGGPIAFADGTGAGAAFNSVQCGVIDASGNMFVTDAGNTRIRKISFPNGLIPNGGVVTTFAGSATAGSADGTGSLGFPMGLNFDPDGNLIVADGGYMRIRKVTPGGVVTTIAGSGSRAFANGTGTAASFNVPNGVAVNRISGVIYISELYNHRIRKIS